MERPAFRGEKMVKIDPEVLKELIKSIPEILKLANVPDNLPMARLQREIQNVKPKMPKVPKKVGTQCRPNRLAMLDQVRNFNKRKKVGTQCRPNRLAMLDQVRNFNTRNLTLNKRKEN